MNTHLCPAAAWPVHLDAQLASQTKWVQNPDPAPSSEPSPPSLHSPMPALWFRPQASGLPGTCCLSYPHPISASPVGSTFTTRPLPSTSPTPRLDHGPWSFLSRTSGGITSSLVFSFCPLGPPLPATPPRPGCSPPHSARVSCWKSVPPGPTLKAQPGAELTMASLTSLLRPHCLLGAA